MKNELAIHNSILADHTVWHTHDRQTMTAYALTCTLLILLFLLSMILTGDTRVFFLQEGGIVETASVFGYFLCVLFIVYRHKTFCLRYFLVLIIFFMLRELDFDKRFTTMGIFKIRFFTSDNVPLIEKIDGAIVVLFLLYVSLSILYHHAKDFFTGLKKGLAVSFGVFLTVILIIMARIMDGLAGKFRMAGIAVSEQIAVHIWALEEILELGIPILILLTLNAHFKNIKISQSFPPLFRHKPESADSASCR